MTRPARSSALGGAAAPSQPGWLSLRPSASKSPERPVNPGPESGAVVPAPGGHQARIPGADGASRCGRRRRSSRGTRSPSRPRSPTRRRTRAPRCAPGGRRAGRRAARPSGRGGCRCRCRAPTRPFPAGRSVRVRSVSFGRQDDQGRPVQPRRLLRRRHGRWLQRGVEGPQVERLGASAPEGRRPDDLRAQPAEHQARPGREVLRGRRRRVAHELPGARRVLRPACVDVGQPQRVRDLVGERAGFGALGLQVVVGDPEGRGGPQRQTAACMNAALLGRTLTGPTIDHAAVGATGARRRHGRPARGGRRHREAPGDRRRRRAGAAPDTPPDRPPA
jgi:hypothetical protein